MYTRSRSPFDEIERANKSGELERQQWKSGSRSSGIDPRARANTEIKIQREGERKGRK
jgi:hypothetical protein